MKKTLILAIACFAANTLFADRSNLRDRTENWLQRGNTELTSGELRGAPTIGGETPTVDPTIPTSAVGDALGLLLILGLAYGGRLFAEKQKSIILK